MLKQLPLENLNIKYKCNVNLDKILPIVLALWDSVFFFSRNTVILTYFLFSYPYKIPSDKRRHFNKTLVLMYQINCWDTLLDTIIDKLKCNKTLILPGSQFTKIRIAYDSPYSSWLSFQRKGLLT